MDYTPPPKTFPDWSEFVELLKPAGDAAELTFEPASVALRAEVYRQLVMNVALGYFMYFQMDPDYPDWIPFLNSAFLLQPNPDDTYYLAAVDPRGTYRISGERGSVRIFTFVLGFEPMGTSDRVGGGLGQLDADIDFLAAPDGTFEIILSAERPAARGHWWRMPPEARTVLVRQRSYDWGRERDARFAIERLDQSGLKPRMPPAEIDRRLRELLGGFTGRLSRMWLKYQRSLRDSGVVNRIEFTGFGGALPVQVYWQGVYQLQEDEALILETEVPKNARYWNVQINDALWNAAEYVYRQSSLNGHQARLDADGKFRAVIALRDPGVPNWLDTCGYLEGTLVGRWYAADSHPLPALKRVPLRSLREHLPPTPWVAAAERAAQLRLRAVGAQLRRRW